jgi:hypothetical protein
VRSYKLVLRKITVEPFAPKCPFRVNRVVFHVSQNFRFAPESGLLYVRSARQVRVGTLAAIRLASAQAETEQASIQLHSDPLCVAGWDKVVVSLMTQAM